MYREEEPFLTRVCVCVCIYTQVYGGEDMFLAPSLAAPLAFLEVQNIWAVEEEEEEEEEETAPCMSLSL